MDQPPPSSMLATPQPAGPGLTSTPSPFAGATSSAKPEPVQFEDIDGEGDRDGDRWANSDDEDEEYTFSGIKVAGRRGREDGIGKKQPVAPFPETMKGVPALLLHPEDRIEDPMGDERERKQKQKEDEPLILRPWAKREDPDARRMRSTQAVFMLRKQEEEVYGTKPRLVRDPNTGYLLPRDMMPVKGFRQPGAGGGTNVGGSQPGSPAGSPHGSPQGGAAASPAMVGHTDAEGGTVHYKRSVDVLNAIKAQRLWNEVLERGQD